MAKKQITVIKRDGNEVPYNVEKIINAINKALNAVDETATPEQMRGLLANLSIHDGISIEDIQEQVQVSLMKEGFYKTATAFIKYREKRKAVRDNAKKNIDYIRNFIRSDNTANATIDDNANVGNHNIAVLNTEMHKEDNKNTNLKIWEIKFKSLYPDLDSKQMLRDFSSIMYCHDLSSQVGEPYCVAITMYPFLVNGIKGIGGLSAAPRNIDSFCGMFVNLLFAVSAQFKGAVATPGMLVYMDYFLRKEWGDSYHETPDTVISSDCCQRELTVRKQIHQYFQQICYTLMQPAGGRGNQAVFWNLSIFDRTFFDTMYGEFYFPDGSTPIWESFNWLQREFLHWLNQERLRCMLTFPVVSACFVYQDHEFLDRELYDYCCGELAKGNSFFIFISDSAESLSSCCRLSSKISKPQFNFTNGQLSEMTGSKNVITLNLNRIIQDCDRAHGIRKAGGWENNTARIKQYLVDILDRVYKYQTAYNEVLQDYLKAHLLTVYDAGFIDMRKQYLTIGINGLNQAAEYLGMKCNKNEEYKLFCNMVFSTIKEQNQSHKTKELMFNTEFTPCESAAIKLYDRDKRDGYWVPEDTNLYASYIYKPNDPEISILDKIYLHGRDFCGDNLDGGSSAHINLDTHLSKKQYEHILKYAAEVGCKYFTFNVVNTECDNCGFITKVPIRECPKCGSKNLIYYDRVIGYLTAIKNWSRGRQEEQKARAYNSNVGHTGEKEGSS